jgi:hypothetical protein
VTTFDAQWTAPNGLPVVVKTFSLFTSNPTSATSPMSQIQLVGVYRTDQPAVPYAGSGWRPICSQIIDANNITCSGGQTISGAQAALKSGSIFYLFDPPSSSLPFVVQWPSSAKYTPLQVRQSELNSPPPTAAPPNTGLPTYTSGIPANGTPTYPISIWGGMYAKVLEKMGTDAQSQAEIAAYQWGLQKLAAGTSTVSQVAAAPTTAPTLATNVKPAVTTPAPVASNTLLYAGIGVAAIGGYFLLK